MSRLLKGVLAGEGSDGVLIVSSFIFLCLGAHATQPKSNTFFVGSAWVPNWVSLWQERGYSRMIRYAWLIFGALTAFACLTVDTLGQESPFKVVGRALDASPAKFQDPEKADSLIADLEHDLKVLKGMEGMEAVAATVLLTQEAVAKIAVSLRTVVGLEAAIATEKARAASFTEERREFSSELEKEPAKAEGEVKPARLEEARTAAKSAVADRDQWKVDELDRARMRQKDLAKAIESLATNLKEAQTSRTAARAALEKGRSENLTKAQLLPLLEVARLRDLDVSQIEHNHNRQSSKAWADSLAGVVHKAMAGMERAEAKMKVMARRLAILEEQSAAWEKTQQALAEGQRSWWEKRLNELPEDRAGERFYIELRLFQFELTAELADINSRRSTRNARFGAGGKLAETRTEARDLHERVKRSTSGDSFDELPDEASELRELLEESDRRLARIVEATAEMDGIRDETRQHLRISSSSVRGISARVAKARADAREASAGGSGANSREWDRLEDVLPRLCNERLVAWQGLRDDLKRQTVELDGVRREIMDDSTMLRSRLLWTRRGSHISWAAFERLLDDLSGFMDGLGSDTAGWMSAAQSHVADKDNRFRVGLGAVLLLVAVMVFRLIHRRLPRTYEWIEGRSDHRASSVLLTVLRRTDVAFMVAIALVGVPLAAGFPRSVIIPMAILFLSPFLYRFGRCLVDILFAPGADSGRIVKLDEGVTRLLHRAGVQPLNLAICFVPLGLLMETGGYGEVNPGFVEIWWLVFKVLLHALLIFTLFRPALIGALIRGESVLALWMKTWLLLAWPLVVGAVIGLFVLDSLRYSEAAGFFRLLLIKLLALATLAYVLYRFLLRRTVPSREFDDVEEESFTDEAEWLKEGRRRLVNRLIRIGLRVLVFVPAVFLAGRLTPRLSTDDLAGAASTWTGGLAANSIVLAVLTLWGAFLVRRYWRDVMRFFFMPGSRVDAGLHYTFTTLASYGIMGAGVFWALRILKVDSDQIAWVMSALVLGIGFGLQSIFRNFVSGIILLVERPVKVGDNVTIGGRGGSVEKITMRATTVMSWDGTGIVIPNEELIGGTVTNHSLGHPRLRTHLSVGVAYGSDVAEVRRLILEAAVRHGLILKRPAADVFFVGFGDSSLDFELRYWTSTGTHRLRVGSDIRFAIDAAFRRHGIEIPFPQRDITLRGVDGDVVRGFGGEPVEKEASADGAGGYDPTTDGSDRGSRGDSDDD